MLHDDAPERGRRLAAVAAALLVLVVVGGAVVRSRLPPRPLEVSVASVSGTALQGDGFVRVLLALQAQGARDLAEAELTVAGSRELGRHPAEFDGRGRMTVQVDVTPSCAAVAAGIAPGQLALDVRDESGRRQRVVLVLPPEGPLERLLHHPCEEKASAGP
jgi:ribonuclease PH